ncbi:MAG: alpha/beta fold hydrolase [Proteobacteria bacterium]|nr:MAG: alpha/beta fold hydrolase [Pseudomonadota bacterium]
MVNIEVSKKLYPFTGEYLPLAHKAKMHYLDEGAGPTLLCLHGNPTWSFYYRNLVGRMRNAYRVVVPDHIGCGLSDKPGDEAYSYRLEQRVEDIEELVKTLGLKDITLILHDWGGMIGLSFATRNPSLVKRIILMNTSGFPLPKTKALPFTLHLSRTPLLGDILLRGFNAFAVTASWIGCKYKRLSPTLRKAYRAPYTTWNNRRAVHRFVQDIPLSAKDPSWATVSFTDKHLESLSDKPMQIIWGEKDFIFDNHFLSEWRRRMPKAEIHSYPEGGHYILEDLGDEAIDLMKDFLNRHPIEPARVYH